MRVMVMARRRWASRDVPFGDVARGCAAFVFLTAVTGACGDDGASIAMDAAGADGDGTRADAADGRVAGDGGSFDARADSSASRDASSSDPPLNVPMSIFAPPVPRPDHVAAIGILRAAVGIDARDRAVADRGDRRAFGVEPIDAWMEVVATRARLPARAERRRDRFALVPEPFGSMDDELVMELHFPVRPAFLELRDLDGTVLRLGDRPTARR